MNIHLQKVFQVIETQIDKLETKIEEIDDCNNDWGSYNMEELIKELSETHQHIKQNTFVFDELLKLCVELRDRKTEGEKVIDEFIKVFCIDDIKELKDGTNS